MLPKWEQHSQVVMLGQVFGVFSSKIQHWFSFRETGVIGGVFRCGVDVVLGAAINICHFCLKLWFLVFGDCDCDCIVEVYNITSLKVPVF